MVSLVERVISGGQTGVDRAALDVALDLGVPCGGWCPKHRTAEDGRLDARYPLEETPAEEYAQRTEWNVRDADGTLILTLGPPSGGTAMTITYAQQLSKPYHMVDLASAPDIAQVRQWLAAHDIRVLNVAGPRESKVPGIYQRARAVLEPLFSGACSA